MAFELVTDLDTVEVGLRAGDVLRRNPNARVPLLEDGDFVLWESRALRGYRASLHPEAGLVPHDSATQAPMDQWAWRQAIPPGPAMQKLSFGLFLKGKFGMGDADPATVASERKACDRFPDVPQKGLAGKARIVGAPSLAAFCIATSFMYRARSRDFARCPARPLRRTFPAALPPRLRGTLPVMRPATGSRQYV